MQKTVYFILILFFWLGCGLQSKSSENAAVEASPTSSTTSSSIVLPSIISISFPSALKSVSSDIFVKNIQAKIAIEKEQLKLLEQIANKLTRECQGLEECYVDANNSAFLGKIKLNQYDSTLKYQYKLSLVTSNQEKISFSWSSVRTDVLTVYEKENNHVAMHYFKDISAQKEALYIDENQIISQNSLMISLDSNNTEYRLRSNYISKEKSASFNILVKDEILLEENENIFSLDNDYSNVEEGAYVLLSSANDTQPSNLLEVFENAQGSFLSFDHKVQGFTYKEAGNEYVTSPTPSDDAVIPSRITALD